MIGYKAFNKDLKCRDFQYEIGKTYEMEEEPIICEKGFHFCKNPIDVFGYYDFTNSIRICKVEALGTIIQEGTKYVTNKIKIVEEIPYDVIEIMIDSRNKYNIGCYNTGVDNTGDYNSGDYNSGNYNSGDYNTGNSNSGNYNSGDSNSGGKNTGDCNSGERNTGNYNTGNSNSGNCNIGDCNTGFDNKGNRNTGACNTGNCNSGNFNIGDSNTGSFNKGNRNTGFFNSVNSKLKFFNKESDFYSQDDFIASIDYNFDRLMIMIFNKELNKEDWSHIRALPNYDPEIFFEITGIKDQDFYKEDK